MFNDLKLSLRHLRRTPGYTASAVLVLALGIGLNAAMFGMCWLVAFSDRPFRDPDALVQLYSRKTNEPDSYRAFSYPAYRELSARPEVFEAVTAHQITAVGVREGGGTTRRMLASLVSANYFDVLGRPPARGRAFTPDEDRPGADVPVVVVSHAYWRRAGADPALLGGTLRVNERLFTVVGIAPPGFTGTSTLFGPELFFPLGVADSLAGGFEGRSARKLDQPDHFALFLVGRLRPGTTADTAAPGLERAAAAVRAAFPAEYVERELQVGALPRFSTGTRPADESALATVAVLFLGMTAAVLAIVCLNLASMQMARGQARRRELAIRLALGGGRGRIVRQLLTEGLVLAAAGSVLGVAAGAFSSGWLIASLTSRLPVSIAMDTAAWPAMAAGAVLFSVLATLLFALGPALRHTRGDLVTDLKRAAGEDTRARRFRLLPRHPLVSVQIALSLALLIASGLFLRMARQAAQADLGVDADATVLAEVDASLAAYDEARGLDAYARVEDRLRGLPGVEAASVGVTVPFGTVGLGRSVRRFGAPDTEAPVDARWNAVGASYFTAMGIPVKAGRAFSDTEARQKGAPPVAVIDDVLARELFPQGDALGRTITLEDDGEPARVPVEIVGVVAEVRDDFFDETPGRAVYVPFAQAYHGAAHFHVRPRAGAGLLADAVRREIREAEPGLPLFRVVTFGQHLETSLERWAVDLLAGTFTAVAALAALVAVVGIYGATSYAVSRRTREIGVRMALGASRRRVLGMVVREGLYVTVGGLAVGSLLGLALGRMLDAVFVEVVTFDPATYAVAPALLLVACLAAAFVPARRATAIAPTIALRSE
ncbi:MAG: ADOP family duplicated permease [Vicinamibacteria bacterium]